eukprot:204552-Chlamydomonas_euryale.AAC.3
MQRGNVVMDDAVARRCPQLSSCSSITSTQALTLAALVAASVSSTGLPSTSVIFHVRPAWRRRSTYVMPSAADADITPPSLHPASCHRHATAGQSTCGVV